jgi:pyruvate formate lyase activating enzyme
MKGMVFDIRSFSVHDGPGIRLTVFLKGCPLRCIWCHNPESQLPCQEETTRIQKLGEIKHEIKETIGREMSATDIVERALADKPFFDESGGGVTISGGEPLMQADFTSEMLRLSKQHAIHTAIDTSGYAEADNLYKVIPFTDLFLYDLKLMDEAAHIKHTGKSNQLILNNLQKIISLRLRVFIRIPLIQDITDTESNLSSIRKFLSEAGGVERIDLLPYHHLATGKYERLQMPFTTLNKQPYSRDHAEKIKSYLSDVAEYVSIGG